jgi:IS5 family transposase
MINLRIFVVKMQVFVTKTGAYLMTKLENVQRNLFEHLLCDIFEVAPELTAMDKVLCEDERLLDEVKEVFDSRASYSRTLGRHSVAVESIVRLILVKHIYGWTYRFTQQQVRDSYSLRHFTRIYYDKVPHYSILCRYERLIPAETLKRLNEKIVDIAKARKVTRGRKLRVDTTVVETNIHHPTDSSLLSDSVRVLSRIIEKARDFGLASGKVVRNFSRSTKRQVLNIVKFARGRSDASKEAFKKSYEKIINITKQVVNNIEQIRETIQEDTSLEAFAVKDEIDHYIPLVRKVISQTKRRVLKGESVPTAQKVYSIFEPHSYVVRKGKSHKANEFGQVIKLQEADGGIITDYQTYWSQPDDAGELIPSIQKHTDIFGRAPYLVAADRGFYSQNNEQMAHEMGVKRVCVPKTGKLSKERKQLQKSRWFKQGQKFRAGCEGRISVMKRAHGFNRCRNKGQEGFDGWIGWGVIAKNVKVIAAA